MRTPVSVRTPALLDEATWTARKKSLRVTDGPAAIPHVVAWNLTQRCNLACNHCYISAGPWHQTGDELTLAECKRIADEIFEINPGPMFVLTGGEPLLRPDLEEFADYCVARGATVVVGTNGTGLTEARIKSLKAAGVTGVAVSIDSLVPSVHNAFRHGKIALEQTIQAIERLRKQKLDFIIQTTVTQDNRRELADLVRWSADKGAVSFNLYFLVRTGRGEEMQELDPAENESVLEELVALEGEYRGQMLIRSKCQPALMRLVHQRASDSPLMNYGTRCPCGVQYCRITPQGKLTPCPYLPVEAGDLRKQSFAEVWNDSPVLASIRSRSYSGKCGTCEYRNVCGGCRARAYADTGDLLGPDESCSYEPTGTAELVGVADTMYGAPVKAELRWTPEAEARMRRIPSFVRGVVVKRTEDWARRNAHDLITLELLDELRSGMPIDFSKKRPFFLSRSSDEEE